MAALISQKVFFPIALKLAHRIPTNLDHHLIIGLRWHVTAGIVLLGAYLAFRLPLDLTDFEHGLLDKIFGTAGAILGVTALVSVVSIVIDWYLEVLDGKALHGLDPRLLPLLRRVAVIVLYGLGGLLILDLLSINISPLIAGLGLGGLAVALALQPTLSNLFAGTYVMTEGVINPGDYIELESGIAGYVVGVSWRSTRIRTWGNNLVVVPNARFADTIFTNYREPDPAVNVYLTCGVSYDSDLEQVEAVSRRTMEALLESDPNGVKEYGAWFAFDSFGDSNVDFWLFVQARDRLASFDLQSALIRDLHARFREEGIVINYPVRALQFPDGWTPDGARAGEAAQSGRPPAPPRRFPPPTAAPGQESRTMADGPPPTGEGPEG